MSSIEELLAHIPPLAADTSNSSAPEVGISCHHLSSCMSCQPVNGSEPKLIQALNKEFQNMLLQKRSIATAGRSTAISPELSHFRASGDTGEDRIDSPPHVDRHTRMYFDRENHPESENSKSASNMPLNSNRFFTFGHPKVDQVGAISIGYPHPLVAESEAELSEDWEISEISVVEEDMTEKPESVFEPRDRRMSVSKRLKQADLDQFEHFMSSKSNVAANNLVGSQWTYEPFTPKCGTSYSQVQKKSETHLADQGKTPVGSFEMRINIGMKGYYQY